MEGECMDLRHQTAEGAVHELVLLHERFAAEGGGAHPHVEVVAGTRGVGHVHTRPGQLLRDSLANLFRPRHLSACYTLARPDASNSANTWCRHPLWGRSLTGRPRVRVPRQVLQVDERRGPAA